jgi:hypothetical protein
MRINIFISFLLISLALVTSSQNIKSQDEGRNRIYSIYSEIVDIVKKDTSGLKFILNNSRRNIETIKDTNNIKLCIRKNVWNTFDRDPTMAKLLFDSLARDTTPYGHINLMKTLKYEYEKRRNKSKIIDTLPQDLINDSGCILIFGITNIDDKVFLASVSMMSHQTFFWGICRTYYFTIVEGKAKLHFVNTGYYD